jgi:hypothetical protein
VEILEDHLKKLFFQMKILEDHLKKLFFQMEKVLLQMIGESDHLKRVLLRMGAGPLRLIREPDWLGQVLLQMIGKAESMEIGRLRLERGFLGMGEVSEPLIKLIYLITLMRLVIRSGLKKLWNFSSRRCPRRPIPSGWSHNEAVLCQ